MKSWIYSLVKLCLGAYFLLTSLYCLLASIPYTYFFLIKEPPYGWLIAFARYHSLLYWFAFAAAIFAYWPQRRKPLVPAAWTILALTGIAFTARNFLPNIQNNGTAYIASLVALLPLLLLAGVEVLRDLTAESGNAQGVLFSYSNAALLAIVVAVLSISGSAAPGRLDSQLFLVPASGLELAIFVIVTYLWFALLVLSIANLILLAVYRFTSVRRPARVLLTGSLVFIGLAVACVRFLEDSLTFRGWTAYLFAIVFSGALTLWGLTVLRPFLEMTEPAPFKRRLLLYALCLCLASLALTVPGMIGDNDWDGVVRVAFTLLLWILFSICVFLLRPQLKKYSAPGVIAVLLAGGFCYWAVTATGFLWAKQLGKTEGDVVRTVESYANQDVSFGIVLHLLSGSRNAPCDNLCRTLRQYTNIRNAEAKIDLNLVDQLVPAHEDRPNIFMIIVDSLRQDYVGPYNSRVDFTPNLNAFARDCVVEKRTYTQYAGTSLSEAAIWSGSLLLHAHYVQPFSRVDSLEKLLKTDGYQMIVSYDEILRLILARDPDLTKLDLEKNWNEFELSGTLHQLESILDNRSDTSRPIFFYAQPKNVHQLARNRLPLLKNSNWTSRPGFSNRISFELHQVDEILGGFFAYLKSHGLYDNSIIIISADHGDATGELGRVGHSSIIFPEVMRVPLLIHLPKKMQGRLASDPDSISTLTDITPTLYYLLGHRPIKINPLFGHPLFTQTREELQKYPRNDLFLASDTRAAYGLLEDNGRFMYVTYDSPPSSFLFDLANDPNATRNALTDPVKKGYEQRVIQYLQEIANFYEYKPTGGTTVVIPR
ncbi:MAG TPA: sulfatase-like hydrolase/transferase [Candidatus Angelobacter sp.]|nr:sulfatase-like hydrolase/transferase [Candidatus Angelobacter sp.]